MGGPVKNPGRPGLKAKPTPGGPGFLTGAPECQVLGCLDRPPTAYGFDTDLWTARRVPERIHTRFGVRFHPSDLREWLSARNDSPQKPARPARQRDQSGIDRWVARDRERIQKRPGPSAHLVPIDETGLFLNPLGPRRRTR
ncbi:Transposase ISLbp6 OS=mine drainage metagenome GN=B2A_12184 PE=4 SV=1: HTH_33 [Gemmata massiliana]|uniref:Winged helix-turn helix domain-containing protein n=1 Tax=Gemmata massiliana TaxID=1210884 RepID=A0A6P2D860_9BACT|nr:winged helix-turn-helix domain-containing protein [Gemmata massiliana]VTR95702.1 Transposase ISLbp6 OS=mine drainage metagenome GN=B2A_12184 PE=4 SV=1: HTH_33 [Gemmata massiliana]